MFRITPSGRPIAKMSYAMRNNIHHAEAYKEEFRQKAISNYENIEGNIECQDGYKQELYDPAKVMGYVNELKSYKVTDIKVGPGYLYQGSASYEGTLDGRYMVNFLYVGLALFVIGTLLNRRYASGERMLQPYVMGSFGGFLILGYMISQLFRENKFAVLLITMCIMLLLATEIVSFDMIADIHEKREQENNTPDMRM